MMDNRILRPKPTPVLAGLPAVLTPSPAGFQGIVLSGGGVVALPSTQTISGGTP